MRSYFLFVLLGVLALGCSGSGNTPAFFQSPVDIRASTTDVSFRGRSTRLLFVADEQGGVIGVFDQLSETYVDTDGGDTFDNSPIIVGGEVKAIAIHERTQGPRIYVADAFHRELFAYDAQVPTDSTSVIIPHAPVDLGGTAVGRTSHPLFRDADRRSTPTLSAITVNPGVAQNEQWDLTFGNGIGFQVIGSKSGILPGLVPENSPYSTPDGSISFTIFSGLDRTSDNDRFRFGTVVAKPLPLVGAPIDLQTDNSFLYIVTRDPAEVLVFDLSTLTLTSTFPIADPNPGRAVLGGGHLYVPDQSVGNVFDLDTVGFTSAVLTTGFPARSAGLDESHEHLFLVPSSTRTLGVWNLVGSTLSQIPLSEEGYFFTPFTTSVGSFGLVTLATGDIDIIALSTLTRFDTRIIDSPTQSDAFSELFNDEGASSAPELISVNTADGVTKNERWQLIFEGVLPGLGGATATAAGALLTTVGVDFQALGVQVGDHIVLDPTGTGEEIEIDQILSATSLQLTQTPTSAGPYLFEIRPAHQFTVIGSQSGLQDLRVTEGIPYTSDAGSIALTIRPSITLPTTRGDYFTFLTTDGFEPIRTSQKRLGVSAAVFTRPGQNVPTAYVVQKGSRNLSFLDLIGWAERAAIQ